MISFVQSSVAPIIQIETNHID